jgi:hypothetical protein
MIETNTILSYFKTAGLTNQIEFGNGPEFNGTRCETVFRSSLRRQLRDSYEIRVEQNGKTHGPINVFKLTNQSVLTWDDHWIDARDNTIIDPLIRHMNLQRNELVYVNMNTPRLGLKTLSLEGNKNLSHLYIHEAPELTELDLSGCVSLRHVALGINRSITKLSLNGCGLSGPVLEQVLRDFRPVITASANVAGVGMFRKTSTTLLDLRGNDVDWSNRNIASKIRLLLCNNWAVKWDQAPPANIVPIRLYSVPVESRVVTR